MRKSYPTDLSDTEWECLKAYLPASKLQNRMHKHSLRDIFDAIFYILKSGCPWGLLPGDCTMADRILPLPQIPQEGVVALHLQGPAGGTEEEGGQGPPEPSAPIIDSQSVATTGESAGPPYGEDHRKGYDAHKKVKGRKRHLLVDTLGLPLAVYLTPADVQDRSGARLLLGGLKSLLPRLKKIWADGAYSGKELMQWCRERGEWELEVVERDREAQGFKVLPKRWIVERTIAWLVRNRRLAKDYERKVREHRDLHRSGDDPPHLEAAGEGNMNLTKHSLRINQQPRSQT